MAAGKKDESTENQPSPEATIEAKKKRKKLFLFIGLGILLVLISVGATFLVVSKMMGSKHSDDASTDEAKKVVIAPAIYYALKPNFTVNYDVNGRQRFLQTELTLMYRDESVKKIFEEHMPEVRNGLVMLLSNQVFNDLQTAEGKEKLRAAALKTVQDIISKETAQVAENTKEKNSDKEKSKENGDEKKSEPNIEQVLFTQFVMQ